MSVGPVAPVGAFTTNTRPATTERRPAPEPETPPPPRETPADRVVLSSTAGRGDAPELKLSFEQLQQMVTKREPRTAAKAEAAPRTTEPREAATRPEPAARQTPERAPAADAPTPDRAARDVKPTPRRADTADGS